MDKQMSALIPAGTNDIIPFQTAAHLWEYCCRCSAGSNWHTASSQELGQDRAGILCRVSGESSACEAHTHIGTMHMSVHRYTQRYTTCPP